VARIVRATHGAQTAADGCVRELMLDMEQFIYTSATTRKGTGLQTVASSSGIDDSSIAELEGMFGFFGPIPSDVPADGILSFVQFQPGRYAAWKLHVHGRDASGSRRNIWVHCIVFGDEDLVGLGGDPFCLDDLGVFRRPEDGIPEILERLPQPAVDYRAFDSAWLTGLDPTEVEILLAAGLCKGTAVLAAKHVPVNAIRALRYLVPMLQRGKMTFYGLVTRIPSRPAKLMVVPQDRYESSMVEAGIVAASLSTHEYHGEDPTRYASLVANYLCNGQVKQLQDLLRMAEDLGIDVCSSEADEYVRLFVEYPKYVVDLDIGAFLERCGTLDNKSSNQAVKIYRAKGILAIAEMALGTTNSPSKLREIIEALKSADKDLDKVGRNRSRRHVTSLWERLYKIPEALPSLLSYSQLGPDRYKRQIDALSRDFERYKKYFDLSCPNPRRQLAFWREVDRELPGSLEDGLGTWVAACLASSAIRTMKTSDLEQTWAGISGRIRSAQALRLVWQTLRQVPPHAGYVRMACDILVELVKDRSTDDVESWFVWASGCSLIFDQGAQCYGQLQRDHGTILTLAEKLWSSKHITMVTALQLVLCATSTSMESGNCLFEFLRRIPIKERFFLIAHDIPHDLRKIVRLPGLWDSLVPTSAKEARVLGAIAPNFLKGLRRSDRKSLLNVLQKTYDRFPLSGVGRPVIAARRWKKIRRFAMTVLLGSIAVMCGIWAFHAWWSQREPSSKAAKSSVLDAWKQRSDADSASRELMVMGYTYTRAELLNEALLSRAIRRAKYGATGMESDDLSRYAMNVLGPDRKDRPYVFLSQREVRQALQMLQNEGKSSSSCSGTLKDRTLGIDGSDLDALKNPIRQARRKESVAPSCSSGGGISPLIYEWCRMQKTSLRNEGQQVKSGDQTLVKGLSDDDVWLVNVAVEAVIVPVDGRVEAQMFSDKIELILAEGEQPEKMPVQARNEVFDENTAADLLKTSQPPERAATTLSTAEHQNAGK